MISWLFVHKGDNHLARQTLKEMWTSERGLKRVSMWVADGLTLAEVCKRMGIDRSYLTKLRKQSPELEAAISTEREIVDHEVENAMFKSASGYMVTETRKTVMIDASGNRSEKIETYDKHVPANSVAQIFWLKNRKPSHWRDKQETELSGGIGLVQIVDDISRKDVTDTIEGGDTNG